MKKLSVTAVITASMLAGWALAGCTSTNSTSPTTQPDTTPSSAEPSASSTAPNATVVGPGQWTWRDSSEARLELPAGSVLIVEDAQGATGAIDDPQVAVFSGQNPVSITAIGEGVTSGFIQSGDDTVSFTVFVTGGTTAASTIAREIVGKSTKQAKAAVEKAGYVWRVTSKDGKPLPVTMDYSPDRVNVDVQDGVVTAAHTG